MCAACSGVGAEEVRSHRLLVELSEGSLVRVQTTIADELFQGDLRIARAADPVHFEHDRTGHSLSFVEEKRVEDLTSHLVESIRTIKDGPKAGVSDFEIHIDSRVG